MPQRKVKTTYTRAKTTPSRRRRERKQTLEEFHEAYIPPSRVPTGLSPLAKYLHENADSGLTTQEMVEQFQEYDCTHAEKERVITGHKEIYTCVECGLIEVKVIK